MNTDATKSKGEGEPERALPTREMLKPTRYKLEVNLTIVKEEWNGPLSGDGLPRIDEENSGGYWNNSFSNERLTVNETMQLGSMDFMELMKVLGKLHDAVKNVKQ